MRRRTALKLAGAGLLIAQRATAQGAAASSALDPHARMRWARGLEGQRQADLGNGRFLNPVFAGDHPDPALLRVGNDYYLTFSSFDAVPGLPVWHSRDLVNWQLLTSALTTPVGSVWAPDLCHVGGRYYCYFPARTAARRSNFVITAETMAGPWSAPVDLGLPDHIDPAHVTDADGTRWLYLSGGDRIRLSADGMQTQGAVEHVYDPWRYPDDWVVESFSPEGPKLCQRGDYWYLVTAVGGTAGPPTGHMVIVSRSRQLAGPWEHCPHNPLVRTRSAAEKWWSRGHATLFIGPEDRWWMIYHGYENGYWTLGRQTLLEPVRWTGEGWPVATGGDLARPMVKPLQLAGQQHGVALSDQFAGNSLRPQWSFYDPASGEAPRWRLQSGTLHLAARGATPSDCSPLCVIVGDHAYRVTVDLEVDAGAEGGVLLFYNRRLYAGLGLHKDGLVMHRYGLQRQRQALPGIGNALRIRLSNERNILTIHTSPVGQEQWRKFDVQMEVSGYHHNVAYDFLSLRPALYAAGRGNVRFRQFVYEALP